MTDEARIAIAVSCRDCDDIPKVPGAGTVIEDPRGNVQLMHNGVRVFADSHYGSYNTEVIRQLRGHHEPQEERAFYEVLGRLKAEATIMELGSFWAYYSIWFLSAVPESKAILVEPLESSLQAGVKNCQLNGARATSVRASIGAITSPESAVELWPGMVTVVEQTTVDALMSSLGLRRVELLHADIQGAEVKMLRGAINSLSKRSIEWLFISTHGENLHQKCLGILRSHRYAIIAEHTPMESFSVDGLIVASSKPGQRIRISKRASWKTRRAKLRAELRIRLLEPLGLRPETT